jgi:5-methylcytosine-specific restriction endonuclease McrA
MLNRVVAAHPLASQEPYNRIKFSRVDGNGTPLYKVGQDRKELGAAAALRSALEKYGAKCFHCEKHMPKQRLSQDCTRDHLRPKKDGGGDYLHNLVFACGDCNRRKGSVDLISFRPEVGGKYLKALDEHIERCLKHLGS